MKLTQGQLEIYEDLKKWNNFKEDDLTKDGEEKFSHLAHLRNPADRYKWFCDPMNRKKAKIPDIVLEVA